MADRADPFGDLDLSGFAPSAPVKPKVRAEVIRQVSEANNFPSRRAPKQQRRHRTGRNVQFNIKARQETINRFIAISDRQGWVFGETLDHAVDALERSLK